MEMLSDCEQGTRNEMHIHTQTAVLVRILVFCKRLSLWYRGRCRDSSKVAKRTPRGLLSFFQSVKRMNGPVVFTLYPKELSDEELERREDKYRHGVGVWKESIDEEEEEEVALP